MACLLSNLYSKLCVLSCVQLCNSMTVARQATLSMEFSRQEYYSRLPFPAPGDLPDPGIELMYLVSLALAGRFFTTCATCEAPFFQILGC